MSGWMIDVGHEYLKGHLLAAQHEQNSGLAREPGIRVSEKTSLRSTMTDNEASPVNLAEHTAAKGRVVSEGTRKNRHCPVVTTRG